MDSVWVSYHPIKLRPVRQEMLPVVKVKLPQFQSHALMSLMHLGCWPLPRGWLGLCLGGGGFRGTWRMVPPSQWM